MAIPQGVTAHVEMGVALYGPFSFADGCQPVSPILWFCTQEGIELKLPMTVKLPHTVMEEQGIKLVFAKTKHFKDSSDKFLFKKIHSKIEKGHRCGTLTTKHHCFLCIQAEAKTNICSYLLRLFGLTGGLGFSQKELLLRKGFCLHILIKKEDLFTYQIVVVCTYFLETCFRVSHAHKFVCL